MFQHIKSVTLLATLALVLVACGDESSADNNANNDHNNKHNNMMHGDMHDDMSGEEDMSDDMSEDDMSEDDMAAETPEIAGMWEETFNGGMSAGELVIDEMSWGKMILVDYSNEENWAITQNAEDAMFDPGKFLRIVWLEPDMTGFYFCMVDFSLDTEEAARNSMKMADSTDPDNSGCGNFGWSKAVPQQ